MDRPLLRLVLLALCLLLMGSSFVKCTSGDQGLHFVGGSTGDGSDGGDNNSAPTAESFTLRVAPNTPTSDTLLRATDPDGDALTYSIVNEPTLGNVVLNDASTGKFTYTASTPSGIDSFSYQASDGSLVSAVATVTIEIGMGSAMASLAPPDRGIRTCAATPVPLAGLALIAPEAPRAPAC